MSESAQFPLSVRGAVDLSSLAAPVASTAPTQGQAPAAGGFVVDLTEESFSSAVQQSTEVPVLVLLWAPGDQNCVDLASTLSQITDGMNGKFLLGRVDVQAWPRIAAAFQIQDVPAVVGLIAGQPVPLFVGNHDHGTVIGVIDQFLQAAEANGVTGVLAPAEPQEAQETQEPQEPELPPLHQEAYDAIERNDFDAAIAAYTKAVKQDPSDAMASAGLAQVGLLQRTADADLGVVRDTAAREPLNVEAQLAVADLDMMGGKVEDALDRLISLVPQVFAEDREDVRKRLVDYFEILGSDDARVAPARRRLASALF
ncbi:tetratricopeptide repeat protein [Jonesia quinghaiensis]|uniref:tetratricopeptide repeat protein n=1 Tax=Jonesia quinghaiensis TaxID=262806 RepID=UPI0004252CE2|nr:tetratricopeptide repeat protein [Jonesia quinghaiensis]